MGLLLSILVTCVGVVELLAFYHNVTRRVTYRPVQTSLRSVWDQCFKDLEGVRDSLASQLEQLKGHQKAVPVFPNIPTFRLNSLDEVDIEVDNKALARSSRQHPDPTPTRQFIIPEEPEALQSIKQSKAEEYLPEYLIEEHAIHYVLKDNNEPVPLPLPDKYLESEHDSPKPKRPVFGKKVTNDIVEVDGELYFRRSPSPFPSFDLTAPRNSICSELLDLDDTARVSDYEVDEASRYNSHSPARLELTHKLNNCTEINNNYCEKIGVFLNASNSTHSPTECWEHKVLVASSKISESSLPGVLAKQEIVSLLGSNSTGVQETVSNLELPKEHIEGFSSSDDDEEFVDVETFTEEMKNNLDGLDTKKGCIKRKYVKRKRIKAHPESTNKLGSLAPNKGVESTSLRLECNPSKTENVKTGEPFWLIFSGEYTKAMNKDWHGQHFCCWQCDESLTGQRYVLRDDHPYCVSCYESVFANACEKCSRTIGIDSKDLSYKDKHWHEACFLCTTCGDSLVDKQFGSKGDRIYCGRCYDEQFASRCDGCHEIFRAGTKKMEYKTRQWHEKCFCCCVCKVPIGTQSFIPREQEIYCAKCYEEKYATRCIKCNKVITSGGVTYKNEPWHRECFTCTHCQKSLAGERFTSRDEKPYCADCFGELFAKRCFACNKPITGIGGTKFISFEDRHWHNDCFFCASCNTSLVGRGFITDQEDIICPECAKQKLM